MFQTAAKEAMAPFVHIEASTSFDWKSCVDDVSRRVLFDTAWSLSVNGTRLLRAETWFLHALSFPLYRDHTPTHSQKLMYIVQSSYEYVSDIVKRYRTHVVGNFWGSAARFPCSNSRFTITEYVPILFCCIYWFSGTLIADGGICLFQF